VKCRNSFPMYFFIFVSILTLMWLLVGTFVITIVQDIAKKEKDFYNYQQIVTDSVKEIYIFLDDSEMNAIRLRGKKIGEQTEIVLENLRNLNIIAEHLRILDEEVETNKVTIYKFRKSLSALKNTQELFLKNLKRDEINEREYKLLLSEYRIAKLFIKDFINLSSKDNFIQNKALSIELNAKRITSYGLLLLYIIIFMIGSRIVFNNYKEQEKGIKTRDFVINQNLSIAKLDKNFNFLEVTNKLCVLFGLKRNILLKKNFLDFLNDVVNEKELEKMKKTLFLIKHYRGDLAFTFKRNDFYWGRTTIIPNLDKENNILNYQVILNGIQKEKMLEKISILDPLTDVYNRRFFEQNIVKQIDEARFSSYIFNYATLDIDEFKKINDTFGHHMGDKVLKDVVLVLKKFFRRSTDFIYRLGGDEFVITFYSPNIDKAKNYLEELVREIYFLNGDYRFEKLKISVSLGCIHYDSDCIIDKEYLMRKSDENLYIAKEQRNRLIDSEYIEEDCEKETSQK